MAAGGKYGLQQSLRALQQPLTCSWKLMVVPREFSEGGAINPGVMAGVSDGVRARSLPPGVRARSLPRGVPGLLGVIEPCREEEFGLKPMEPVLFDRAGERPGDGSAAPWLFPDGAPSYGLSWEPLLDEKKVAASGGHLPGQRASGE